MYKRFRCQTNLSFVIVGTFTILETNYSGVFMKIIEERRFDFLPQSMWDSLNKTDLKNLNSYRRTYRRYKDTDDQISELEDQLKSLKEKKKSYVTKLTRINWELEHIRNDFYFTFSISYKKKKKYYGCDLNRKKYKKSGGLGSEKLIVGHLQEYYKNDKSKLDEMERMGWNRFVRKVVQDPNGEVYERIIKTMMKDITLGGISLNRDFLFPISK